MANVIRIEEKMAGNITWMVPDYLSVDIDNLNPTEKKIILEKVTLLTNKYAHFIIESLRSGQLGDQAMSLFEQQLSQVFGQLISSKEDLKRRGGI